MRCPLIYSLALSFTLASSAGASQPREVRVPLVIDKGVLFVKAGVDGSRPMLFIFDPGAASYITRYGAAQLRPSDERTLAVGSIAITEQLPVLKGDPMQLDPKHDERLGQIAGTIGSELLNRLVVRIDYRHHEMTLLNPSDFQPPKTDGLSLRIDPYGVPSIPAAVNGVRGPFELDVRAPSSMLFTPFAQSLGFRVSQMEKRRVSSVRIAGWEQTNVPVWISNATSGKFAAHTPLGLLGNDVLDAYVVTFDYHRGMAYLEPDAR